MKNKTNVQTILLIMISVVAAGLCVVSIMQGWEFWVPPLFLAGMIVMWFLHLTQRTDEKLRIFYYAAYAMMVFFFHGVHETSFFDVAVAISLLLVVLSMMDSLLALRLALAEYAVIMGIQLVLAVRTRNVQFDSLNISRILLHVLVVLCVYLLCRKMVGDRNRLYEKLQDSEAEVESISGDIEDFLVNISHELRTPVNVVNGITSLLLQSGEQEDILAIRNAGLRLSRQIEDIQDYTEIKRGAVVLEEEQYMITSLINDVLANFHYQENKEELEFVVDLDPRVPSMMRGDIRKLHKILRHLLDNAMKFTKQGGVYIRITSVKREYGVNLNIEVQDTGIGMNKKITMNTFKGFYQENKKRNRSTGGIGIGLSVVYGFVHKMNGFVTIDSARGKGTTVKLSIPQTVVDPAWCLSVDTAKIKNIIFHVNPAKYKVAKVQDFYRSMAVSMASGLKLNLYSAVSVKDVENLKNKLEISHIFMGAEEYMQAPELFDSYASSGITVAVSAAPGFAVSGESRVIVLPKPLYGFPVAKVLNGGTVESDQLEADLKKKPLFEGVRVLIVDDEPMNLVVAAGMFQDYGMVTEIADSGKEAIDKYTASDYDVIFMDHMMPEMDGVEAMKRIKQLAKNKGTDIMVVALTANAVSGAREMFIKEGFDGFIAKPIDLMEYERVMKNILPTSRIRYVERGES